MSDPDMDLVLRVITRDDRHAFGELVKRHQSGVRNHLRRLTKGDEAWADDLAQDTFVKAYRSVRSYKGAGKFSSWLYQIAYRTFLNDQRRRRPMVPLEEAALEVGSGPALEAGHLFNDLESAMADFKPEARAVFDLHFKKGLSHREIADTLEMALGTVKTHLNRGLNVLRQRLVEWKP